MPCTSNYSSYVSTRVIIYPCSNLGWYLSVKSGINSSLKQIHKLHAHNTTKLFPQAMVGITLAEFGCDWPLVEIWGAMVVALFAVVILLLVFFKFRGELKLLLYIKFGWRPLDRKDDRILGKVSMYLFQESIFSFVVIKVNHTSVTKKMVWSQALQCDSWFGSLSMTWRQFTHSMILLLFGSRK